MRTRLAICVLAVLACFTGPLSSETQPAAPNPIDQLSWLMGGKWTAEGEKGPDGKPFYVEARFRQADNHQGLEFTTWFLTDGKLVPVYSGLYAWHPAKKKFTFLYTDDKGVLTEGEAAWSGNHLEQEFRSSASMPLRTRIALRSCGQGTTTMTGTFDTRTNPVHGSSSSG